jgi:hypothetical protein
MRAMRRLLFVVAALVFGLGLGLGLRSRWPGSGAKPPVDPAAVAVQIRELARLETLEVTLYKKVTFVPSPVPADSFWGDVLGWARHTFATPTGKAIVFADARLGLDLDRLGPGNLAVRAGAVYVVLPPLKVKVELKPADTEIIGSNLNSKETAELLALAKVAFEREVGASAQLRQRARTAAERAVRSLLVALGFVEVHFVDVLPAAGAA